MIYDVEVVSTDLGWLLPPPRDPVALCSSSSRVVVVVVGVGGSSNRISICIFLSQSFFEFS